MAENNRLQRVAEAVGRAGLDAALIMSPAGTCYLSGVHLLTQTVIPERHAYVLVTADGTASYVICNIEEASARAHSQIEDIAIYVEFVEKPAVAAVAALKKHGLLQGRIGFEAEALPAATLTHLEELCPLANFEPWDEGFADTLMIKEPDEIEATRRAGQATRLAIHKGLTGGPAGATELHVANQILQGIMDAGIMPLFNVFATGDTMMQAHAEARRLPLVPGNIVRLDMGGRDTETNHLSDMARTAVVGTPSSAQQETYRALYRAQMAVIEATKPGKPISSLFEVCKREFERQNIPFGMPHIGHGMGIGLHEAPMINPSNHTPIQVGMVLNIEPLVMVPERGESYHIEDLIVVREDGPELLTQPDAELIQIPA